MYYRYQSYQTKIKRCGNVLKLYIYSSPIKYNKEDTSSLFEDMFICDQTLNLTNLKVENDATFSDFISKINVSSEEQEQELLRLSKNLTRCKTNLIDLIDCNVGQNTKFMTLTYKKNQTDWEQSSKDFKLFLLRLKREGIILSYVAVREFQKRGAIHFHLVIFNNEKLDINILKKCWSFGFIKINRIDNYFNVTRYVSKYISKSLITSFVNYPFKRLYNCSRDLKRPKVSYLYELFNSDYLKTCSYTRTYTLADSLETCTYYEFRGGNAIESTSNLLQLMKLQRA